MLTEEAEERTWPTSPTIEPGFCHVSGNPQRIKGESGGGTLSRRMSLEACSYGVQVVRDLGGGRGPGSGEHDLVMGTQAA